MLKTLKTPLRYPGGKSRAIKNIVPLLKTEGIKEYREPFLGGGSIAVDICRNNPDIYIWVNDSYRNLCIFWSILRDRGEDLVDKLQKIKQDNSSVEKSKTLFYEAKEAILDLNVDEFDIAVWFYIINKCSFSGLTESSAFSASASQTSFSVNCISNLIHFSKLIKNWRITNLDYNSLLTVANDEVLIYLDPPYAIKDNLYGKGGKIHKAFNHQEFIERMNRTNAKCVISYNNSNEIINSFYSSIWNVSDFDHGYSMLSVGDYRKNQKERKELLLSNFV